MTNHEPLHISLFADWLENGERGISSNTIVSHLTGIFVGNRYADSYPRDPADFRRCELLLRAVPEAREHLGRLATKGAVWAGLVAEWGDLVALGESEVPGCFDPPRCYASAPKLYARMESIIDGAA